MTTFDASDFKDIVSANGVLSRAGVWTHGISAFQHLSDSGPISQFLVRLDGVADDDNAWRTNRIMRNNHPITDANGVVFNNILLVCYAAPQALVLKYTR